MIPVEQTRLHAHHGDCHPACIASILEVPLEEVPQPTSEELASYLGWAQYLERLSRDFLKPRNLGAMVFGIHTEDLGDVFRPPGYSILCAESPRTSGYHSVVALDGEIVWDPHPERAMGVGAWSDWTVFTVLDPTKPISKLKEERL